MSNLQAVFLAETEELISTLESALLEFERDLSNLRTVENIFRVMHTIKGSASMFGYENLSNITHHLETIFDDIRAYKRQADLQILEITFRTVDHIKSVLRDPDLSQSENKIRQEQLLANIHLMVQQKDVRTSGPVFADSTAVINTYYIFFRPAEGIFRSGNNPLFLIDDLATLGKAIVVPIFRDALFSDNAQADLCYTEFEVVLAGGMTEDDIRDVFLFVSDTADIQIRHIAEGDLLNDLSFSSAFGNREQIPRTAFGYGIVASMVGAVQAKSTMSSVVAADVDRLGQSTSIRVSSTKLDELMNLVSELVTSQARLMLIAEQKGMPDLNAVSENIEKITRRLRDNAFSICLVPIEAVVTRYQRLIRDLSKELSKEVVFTTSGTETELDKSLIEKITDPILHLLRNCMDHGIETPEARRARGKKKEGTIHLKAYHSGTYVHIEISDDGKGIDPARVRSKAINKGLIREDAVLSDADIIELIFSPGFSTADIITDVSGRGVGMDVVRRNIEAVHGEVFVESKLNEGTQFTIRLPLTLSIMDGMLVKIASSDYIIPLAAVDKCFEVETRSLNGDCSQRLVLDGNLVPVFNLRNVFDEERSGLPITQVVKLNCEAFPVGITVDAIVGEYQAVMKPLGDMYQSQDEFSGATILGDGSVALVVDPSRFIRQLLSKSNIENLNKN
ncbi:chemotaxis protein CheA [Chryseolinea sp. T2]|uniref:chemotaxis protein CheA n=1 Tax=Chryseolinea sp. T2 TaxID=3129255 RepID=UPI003076B06C